MRNRRMLGAIAGLALVGAAASAVVVIAATGSGQDDPSKAQQVPCPSVGPAGQTEDMTCFESKATPFAGDATTFGPYRLLPPGTQFIPRDRGGAAASTDIRESTDESAIRESSLYVKPPTGAEETSLKQTLIGSSPLQTLATWAVDGKVVNVVATAYPEEWLPIDVYLHPDGSPLVVKAEKLEGKFAIVMEPSQAPAPNVGYVSVWLDGVEVSLNSPDVDQAALRTLAQTIVQTTG